MKKIYLHFRNRENGNGKSGLKDLDKGYLRCACTFAK